MATTPIKNALPILPAIELITKRMELTIAKIPYVTVIK